MRMCHPGNPGLGGAKSGRLTSKGDRPRVDLLKHTIRSHSSLLESEKYLNPDPLARLVREANEATVKLENQKFEALIDSGSMVSQITLSLAKRLQLQIHQLKTLIPMEGAGGVEVPYIGYIEACLKIPEISAFEEDCLFLVVPDHWYGYCVPVTVGTLHIDMIIAEAIPDELDKISIAWGRGQLFRKIQARQVQIGNQKELEKVEGDIKLTKTIKLKPNETRKLEGRGTYPLNAKRVNVIIEPTNNEGGEYAIPSYTYIKSNSKRVTIGLRNMSCRTVTLTKGTIVAQLSPANKIPNMLAPEFAEDKLEFATGDHLQSRNSKLVNTNSSNHNTDDLENPRIDKLFTKLDLSGSDDWTDSQKQAVHDCIIKYNHIFAAEDLELGKTDLVKHVIHLDDYTPFKE